jgi:hypothetical protein
MIDRQRLPNRRGAETFDLEAGGLRYRATLGRFPDGRPAEIFLTNTKMGSHSDTNARDAAVVASIALQYGAPLEVLRGALMRDEEGRPCGPLGVAVDLIAEQEVGP